MARKPLAESVFDDLLERIIDGTYPPGAALPPENDLAASSDVSRLTVREALKQLQAQNIVQVKRGLGTYVNPAAQWTNLQAILRYASTTADSPDVSLRLLEIRRMVETGAAELAALHATDEDLARMEEANIALQAAHEAKDLDAVTATDIEFHEAIFRASANPFVPVILGPLSQLLYTMRRETSSFHEVQEHAIAHHRLVLEAIRTRNPEVARKAMQAHINQTYDDYEQFIHPEKQHQEIK
ncbi:FadR/GntR family transcriptional regulator [Arthrobacter sp. AET 35A]|uniref:FadR/GntR family transcriptional regulator n=1 Tax=Arthrobacter sp. AET 35A TaxID=2292643 RepID=UPI001781C565|nr:FadR/GntR family transcriptional regulator [Arthrobacter sp. AET 35A]MBE0011204.1 FadR family transcriptional regulator [Arthrobacter sp. AET 35A]